MSGQDENYPERNTNLHAPWRMEYIRLLDDEPDGCFLCRALEQTDKDEKNLLLWRTPRCLTVLNLFPYAGGHLLIAPRAHVAGLEDVDGATLLEMMEITRDATALLARVIKAGGFNVGFNLGRAAGAGLPGHLHLHVVPRWSGDTNFMAVLGDVRVIPQSLTELRRELLEAAAKARLPRALYG
jgi:ATP adenylyltransferase